MNAKFFYRTILSFLVTPLLFGNEAAAGTFLHTATKISFTIEGGLPTFDEDMQRYNYKKTATITDSDLVLYEKSLTPYSRSLNTTLKSSESITIPENTINELVSLLAIAAPSTSMLFHCGSARSCTTDQPLLIITIEKDSSQTILSFDLGRGDVLGVPASFSKIARTILNKSKDLTAQDLRERKNP